MSNANGRPRKYPSDTCYAPGCAEKRDYYGKERERLSQFCAVHRREHERLARIERGVTKIPKLAPLPVRTTPALTAADVYTRWCKDWLCDAYYAGLKVIGMVQADCGYRLTLADERHVWVAADEGLSREAR